MVAATILDSRTWLHIFQFLRTDKYTTIKMRHNTLFFATRKTSTQWQHIHQEKNIPKVRDDISFIRSHVSRINEIARILSSVHKENLHYYQKKKKKN